MTTITLTPVGVVRSSRGVVRDDDWDAEVARIELDTTRFSADALAGLETFSHVEILFYMDRVEAGAIEHAARHPRNNPNWPKVGIFAQRGKNRPNRLGVTVCRVARIEGTVVFVEGLDAVDGSPVLDLKPWVRELGPRGEVVQPDWMSVLMVGYWRKQS